MTLKHFQLDQHITQLQDANLLRKTYSISSGVTPFMRLDGQPYLNFSSNDYLGLAEHPQVVQAAIDYQKAHGLGSGASHLVSGHFEVHDQLEKKLAEITGYDAVMTFSSGFMANMGVIPALIGKDDAVFCDALNHASLIDAVRLSKAQKYIYPHLDMDTLASQLRVSSAQKKLIVTDHVFSMDGTVADMSVLTKLAETYDAALMIDDAHGVGLSYGQSPIQPKADIYMGTLGKALGCYGAFIAGSQELITYLKTKARSYMFTTALPPSLAAAALAALDVIENENERQSQLTSNIALLRDGLAFQGWQLIDSDTAIQPVIIGEELETLAYMQQLKDAGFWVVAIRPPTVPAGSCRLRITLSAAQSTEQVQALVDAMGKFQYGGHHEF